MVDLAGRYVLFAALYYALVAYPLLKVVAWRRRRADRRALAERVAARLASWT